MAPAAEFNGEFQSAAELLEAALRKLKTGLVGVEKGPELRVGTMGPLTCSAEALTTFLHLKYVRGAPAYFPSFDDVCAALLARDIDLALIPHCHPIASELLFDPRFEFEMACAFDKPNPPLHLVGRGDAEYPPEGETICAALPTLWPLVKDIGPPTLSLVPAVSNPAAAKLLVDGRAAYAITNEACLAAFQLKSLKVLKHVVVRWLPVKLVRGAEADARSERRLAGAMDRPLPAVRP